MIPYLQISPCIIDVNGAPLGISLFYCTLFGGLVSALLRARSRLMYIGQHASETYELFCLVVLPAFLGAAFLGKLFYAPLEFARDVYTGQLDALFELPSSTAAMLTGVTAFSIYERRRVLGVQFWRYADILGEAVLLGFVFGRLGCALMHDHPGIPSSSFLATAFPDGARFDLGQLEFLFLLVVVLPIGLIAGRFARADGVQLYVIVATYSVGRFLLDFLRDGDEARYLGLTPAQYLCVAFLIILMRSIPELVRHGIPSAFSGTEHVVPRFPLAPAIERN